MTPLRQTDARRTSAPQLLAWQRSVATCGAVQQFAEHFHCSPEQLGAEHIRRYQRLPAAGEEAWPSTVEVRISALRFLYKRTLKRRDIAYEDLIFPKVPQKLPTVLSREEVARLIEPHPTGCTA